MPRLGIIVSSRAEIHGQFLGLLLQRHHLRSIHMALASVAQWIECYPANQRVTSLIPNQGTCLGCRPGPQWGVYEKQPHIDVSLSLPLCLKINK